MKSTFVFVPALLALLLTDCKSMNNTQKATATGMVVGGAAGALIGHGKHSVVDALIGTVVGGGAGYLIGRHMDKQAEEIKQAVPDAQVTRVGEGINMTFNSGLLFKINSSLLSEEAKVNLEKVATIFKKYPDENILVEGHTDDTGTPEYNLDLSKKRAYAVSDYLASKGVSDSRMDIKWYGEAQPKYSNDNDANRALNRRVELGIMANDQMKQHAQQGSLN